MCIWQRVCKRTSHVELRYIPGAVWCTTTHLSLPSSGLGILEYTVKVSAFNWFSSSTRQFIAKQVVAVCYDIVEVVRRICSVVNEAVGGLDSVKRVCMRDGPCQICYYWLIRSAAYRQNGSRRNHRGSAYQEN